MDDKRRKRKEDKKRAKRAETPEEKLQRKMVKQKEKNDSFFGYTPEDNPFGDASLHDQFVWHKKYDKMNQVFNPTPNSNRFNQTLTLISETPDSETPAP